MKTYAIREIFVTLQGEGARAGTKAVFVRFAGCNLWDGRADNRERAPGACGRWCDTDFASGEKRTPEAILEAMNLAWGPPASGTWKWVVLTGGEPLLQVDKALFRALVADGWRVAIETNGTVALPDGVLPDWLTVSPKLLQESGALSDLKVWKADELKVVLPGGIGKVRWTDVMLQDLAKAGCWGAMYVQPQDPGDPSFVAATFLHGSQPSLREQYEGNVRRCIDFIMGHPTWRLSSQVHKYVRLP